MPRPRKNDPAPLIKPLLAEFARQIAESVEAMTFSRVREVLEGGVGAPNGRRGRVSKRATIHCYYPGCKNPAAPRYGMFCVAEHKGLSAAEKDKYRKQHAGKAPRKAAKKK